MKKTGLLFCVLLFSLSCSGSLRKDTIYVHINEVNSVQIQHLPGPVLNKKKLLTAMLAFPIPFGFIGAHRVMLGCKPWVPVVYVASFGGCFGILPLVDFFVIIFSEDLSKLENNPNVFMWLK